MAKLTWLGEDGPGGPGPSYTEIFGLRFHKDKPVTITNQSVVERARKNRFFKVTDDDDDEGHKHASHAHRGRHGKDED